MKTVIELPRPLWSLVSKIAERKRITVSRIVEESIQKQLTEEARSEHPQPVPDPLFDELRDELGL
ncbi:hypothetical protein [Haloferula sargassicola]|uniref:Ribbon-helix-helix protein CopG domain-containing protein n=1 Tax=Haloferula sargassicola TaxID=490096 RepID=A0ABP9UMU4_9BACT